MIKTFVYALAVVHLIRAENNDFVEVNMRKVMKDAEIKFGAKVHLDVLERYAEQIEQLGPVFQLAYWPTVWEVSGAGPAPHKAEDELMDAWVGSMYMIVAPDVEPMKNTSRLLANKNIEVIGAAHSPPNSYYSTPFDIKRRKKKMENLKEGEKPKPDDTDDWIAVEEEKAKGDPADLKNMMIRESIPDYAKFWASSMKHLNKLIKLPFVELTWEPDSKDLVYFEPDDYAASVKLIRENFRRRNIADDENKIVGPGTSTPSAAKKYIEALVKDREAYDALHAWSIHLPDNEGSIHEIENELLQYKQILKTVVPPSWPKKPVIITEFSIKPTSSYAFGEVGFNGNLDHCYYKLLGTFLKSEDDLPNTMAQSPTTGVRLLANLLLQYSHGFSQSIYKELSDANWSHGCHGLYDRLNRKKQLYVALSSFLKYIPKDAKIVKKQWKNSEECVFAIVKSKTRVVIGIANANDSPCTKSFSLSGLPTDYIERGFTVSYNNGTVSIGATEPSQALVQELPLDYDIFEDEDSVNNSQLVEFDMVIGPRSSATAVIDINKSKKEGKETEGNPKGNKNHTEL